MINILDSPFDLQDEICTKIFEKGIDLNTRLMLEWLVQLVAVLLGTYGVQLFKLIIS